MSRLGAKAAPKAQAAKPEYATVASRKNRYRRRVDEFLTASERLSVDASYSIQTETPKAKRVTLGELHEFGENTYQQTDLREREADHPLDEIGS